MASTTLRFRNASQSAARGAELDDDLAAARALAGRGPAGKLTGDAAVDARAGAVPREPGKQARMDAEPGAMSPAEALQYASWVAQGIDRKAEPGAAPEEGALASAFGFLDEIRGGEPLPEELRERLEGELAVDLRAVRIHIGEAAARAAAALGARAFTAGDRIYFAAGAYDPHGAAGVRLIAHEAAHVAQHARGGGGGSAGGGGAGRVSRPDDAHEQAADAFADRIAGELLRGAGGRGEGAAPARATAPAMAPAMPAPLERNAIDRKSEAEMNDHEKQLFAIQGGAMFGLLPALEGLPADVRTDYEAGRAIGGPRLVAAMKAVAGKGSGWIDYANANHGDMGGLPEDQIRDLMAYLGAPKDARYYKDIPGRSRGHYDGAVDPATSTITLFFRAKIVVATAEQGVAHPVDPSVLEPFKASFKAEVEKVWSGGTIKPAKAIAGVSAFATKTNVAIVDATEHLIFYVMPDELGRSNVGDDRGALREKANEEKSSTCEVFDDTSGKKHHSQTDTQRASTHEFGHAVGLDHPRPQAGADGECAPAYGKTGEERGSIMGAGHERRVLKRGGVDHNDFQPHMAIGEKWGEEILPGPLKAHNKWSVG